jgi:BirA family biotin operon repressor/biotin-[acetyl-CoA-carboxylase] ligase
MPLQTTILRFDSIDSTNLEALRRAKAGAPEGLCIIAREQTAGRGRLERSWQSPKDAGLYFTIVLRPQIEMNAWPLLTLLTALAVSEALMKSYGLRTDIKWPNDICVNDRKLCGILAETVETAGGPAAIIGIGINLRKSALSDELRQAATSVEEITESKPDLERIVAELLKALGERYPLLQTSSGREHIIREWCANSSYAFDRPVRVSLGAESFEGITQGLESDGALRVEIGPGRIRAIRAGDVTALRASTGTHASGVLSGQRAGGAGTDGQ